MAVGNTFGATALSSYGGFWIAFGIILTPGGFEVESSIKTAAGAAVLRDSLGFFLMVFTSVLPELRDHFTDKKPDRAGSFSPSSSC